MRKAYGGILAGGACFAALGILSNTAFAAECLINFDDFGALNRYADKVQNQRTDWVSENPTDYQQVCSSRIARLNAQTWKHFHLVHEDPDFYFYEDFFGEDQDLACNCFIDSGTGFGDGFGKRPGCFANQDPTIPCVTVDHVREPRYATTHNFAELSLLHVPTTTDGTDIDSVCTPDGCLSTAGETFRLRRITFDGSNMNVTLLRLGLQRLRVNEDPPIFVTIPRPVAYTQHNLPPGTYDFSGYGLVERVILQGISNGPPTYSIHEVLIDPEPLLSAGGLELDWYDNFGNPIPQSFQFRSEGVFSSAITSDDWTLISTPTFDTRTLTRVGESVAFDVRVPSEQINPYWIGDVHLYVNIPSAGVDNQWIGYQSLDALEQDAWSTVEFELPPEILTALSGSYPDAEFLIASNLSSNLEPLLIDHIRFSGQQTIMPRCSDGYVIGDEECDDGNLEDGDGCSAMCTVESADVCGLHNATDFGGVNSVADVPANGCLKISEYPGSWVNAIQLQRHPGTSGSVSFAWSNCLGAGVSTLDADWQQVELRTVSSSCETLIEVLGSPDDNVRLSWWGNG